MKKSSGTSGRFCAFGCGFRAGGLAALLGAGALRLGAETGAAGASSSPELASIPQVPTLPAERALSLTAGETPEAGNALHLNFRSAPLRLVLEYLSDAAGFVINQEAQVNGTVDVWSKEAVTRNEAVELLDSVLRRNGFAVVRNGRILTVMQLENIRTADLEVVTGNNPESVSKSDEVVTQIIPVRYATAALLLSNLQPLLPSSASLSANESANSLILVASKKEIRRVLKIVSALDGSIATVSRLSVFTLHYADAKQLAPVLQQLFSPQSSGQNSSQRGQSFNMPGPGGFGAPGFGGDTQNGQSNSGNSGDGTTAKVVVAADEPSNSLLVSAPQGLLSTMSNLVQQIDQPVTEIAELRVFKLNNAEAAELAEQVTQLFPDTSKATSDQNQAGIRFGPFPGPPGMMSNDSDDSQSTSDRAKKKSQVLALADRRSGSLLVSAPGTLMPAIAKVVQQLDANPARKELVRVYDLHGADPQDVHQALQDLFNRNNTQRTTTAANSLSGENNPLSTRETEQQSTATSTSGSSGSGTGSPTTGQRGGTAGTGF